VTGLFVLTSPRKMEDRWKYVRAVVAQAVREKLDTFKWLLVDGSAEDAIELQTVAPGWNVFQFQRPDGMWLGGNKWPYWRLLQLAEEETEDLDEALVLEDDLTFPINALTRMITLRNPRDVDVMQFFSGFLFKDKETYPGLWRTPAPVQGCQALKYSVDALRRLVAWAGNPEWQKFNESDVALGLAQTRLGLRFANHLPDIVQHAGDVSHVGQGMLVEAGITDEATKEIATKSLAGRTSATYPGDNFDCMRLFNRHDLYL
jgi:hypothetical protein